MPIEDRYQHDIENLQLDENLEASNDDLEAVNDDIDEISSKVQSRVKGQLDIVSKTGIVAGTLGLLGGMGRSIIQNTDNDDFLRQTNIDRVEEFIEEKFADTHFESDLLVRIGHDNVFTNLLRLFKKVEGRRPNILTRAIAGIPYTLYTSLTSALGKVDYYNPYTNTVTVYSSNEAIAAREISKAMEQNSRKLQTLHAFFRDFWPIRILKDYQANKIAMQHLNNQERAEAAQVLEPSFTSRIVPYPIFRLLTTLPFLAAYATSLPGLFHGMSMQNNEDGKEIARGNDNWFYHKQGKEDKQQEAEQSKQEKAA